MMTDLYDRMTVTVPEGETDGIRIERFDVKEDSPGRIYLALKGRALPVGTYTRLMEGGQLWMSDTPAEKKDHLEPLEAIERLKAKRVLLNGLGLGMVLQAALSYDHVEQVDVVEKDERIIKLVGPHYTRDPRVRIHHADAFVQCTQWPPKSHWDVGWTDIWGDPNPDHLGDMDEMDAMHEDLCAWHGCWGRDLIENSRYW